jgi:dUTP pyrophosphatase
MDTLISNIKQSRRFVTGKNVCDNFAILQLAVCDENMKDKYSSAVVNHNKNMMERFYPDSGFDLLFPNDVAFDSPFATKFVDFQVKAEMFYVDCTSDTYSGSAFTVHPRSSISKTPLMLANHTGIIDAGYRGNLIGAFRWLNVDLDTKNYNVQQYTRLLQACHPTLCPVYVVLVNEEELSTSERGTGGFGSTGK